MHNSWIELSRRALEKNLRFLCRRIGKGVRFTSVVKGNAYGHGIASFVPLAESCGVRSFAVYSAQEAWEVREAQTSDADVFIMGAASADEVVWAVREGLEIAVFDAERLALAIATARACGRPARVHLELETGLHRTGLESGDLADVVAQLAAHPGQARVEGVFTHFAGAETASNSLRIRSQFERYREQLGWLAEQGVTPRYRHSACSAAALTYPESVLDMARIGIAQYGYWPSRETRMRLVLEAEQAGRHWVDPVRQVIAWKTRIVATKRVAAGEFIGYGNAYLTERPTRIAVLPVGYADGFSRSLSNLGRVLVHGRRVPVVGVVNMSGMTIDVSQVPEAAVGHEVVLLGHQGRRHISVSSFSDMSGVMNYETLVRLPADLPRRIVD